MNNEYLLGAARWSKAWGFLTVLLTSISGADIIKTAVMAAVGAIVSFTVSVLLKFCITRWRK